MKDVVLLTHSNCPDGSACAIIFQAAGGRKENIIFCNPSHDDVDEAVLDFLALDNDDDLIIADLSISKDLAEEIDQSHNRDRVFLLDHHKSAIPLNKYEWCEVSVKNENCGSAMLFDYLYFKLPAGKQAANMAKYDDLITYVDDRDRWQNKYEKSKEIAMLHFYLGQKRFIERFLNSPDCELSENESYALEIEKEKLDYYVKKQCEEVSVRNCQLNNKNYKIGFVICDKNQSDVGHYILENRQLDMVVMVSARTISLRVSENSDIDSAEIAKQWGGGGHIRAAGMSAKNVFGHDLLELAAERLFKS